jgi:AmmeMemoRadiSam system protein B
MDDKTVFIASSDLSHYHPYDAAKELDSGASKPSATGTLAR